MEGEFEEHGDCKGNNLATMSGVQRRATMGQTGVLNG